MGKRIAISKGGGKSITPAKKQIKQAPPQKQLQQQIKEELAQRVEERLSGLTQNITSGENRIKNIDIETITLKTQIDELREQRRNIPTDAGRREFDSKISNLVSRRRRLRTERDRIRNELSNLRDERAGRRDILLGNESSLAREIRETILSRQKTSPQEIKSVETAKETPAISKKTETQPPKPTKRSGTFTEAEKKGFFDTSIKDKFESFKDRLRSFRTSKESLTIGNKADSPQNEVTVSELEKQEFNTIKNNRITAENNKRDINNAKITLTKQLSIGSITKDEYSKAIGDILEIEKDNSKYLNDVRKAEENFKFSEGSRKYNVVRNVTYDIDPSRNVGNIVVVSGRNLSPEQLEYLKRQKETELGISQAIDDRKLQNMIPLASVSLGGTPDKLTSEERELLKIKKEKTETQVIADPTLEGIPTEFSEPLGDISFGRKIQKIALVGGREQTKQILTDIGITEVGSGVGELLGFEDFLGFETEKRRIKQAGGIRNLRNQRDRAFQERILRFAEANPDVNSDRILTEYIKQNPSVVLESPGAQLPIGGLIGLAGRVGINVVGKKLSQEGIKKLSVALIGTGVAGTVLDLSLTERSERFAKLGNISLLWFGAYLTGPRIGVSDRTVNLKPIKSEIVGVQNTATINGQKVTGRIMRVRTTLKDGEKTVSIKQYVVSRSTKGKTTDYIITPKQNIGGIKFNYRKQLVGKSDSARIKTILNNAENKAVLSKKLTKTASVTKSKELLEFEKASKRIEQADYLIPAEEGADSLLFESELDILTGEPTVSVVRTKTKNKITGFRGKIKEPSADPFEIEGVIIDDDLLNPDILRKPISSGKLKKIGKKQVKRAKTVEDELFGESQEIDNLLNPDIRRKPTQPPKKQGQVSRLKQKPRDELDNILDDPTADEILGTAKTLRRQKVRGRSRLRTKPVVGVIPISGEDSLFNFDEALNPFQPQSIRTPTKTTIRQKTRTETAPIDILDIGPIGEFEETPRSTQRPPKAPKIPKTLVPGIPVFIPGFDDNLDQFLGAGDDALLSIEKDIAELEDILG